jgi:hypothetical protein
METQQHTHGTQPAPRPHALGPVAIDGTLIVKWISGRNGSFAVGDLHTAIGEFRVKDTLLEQFDEGEYTGRFWVSQIYSKSYEYRGRITIETRANLADLQIDTEADAPKDTGFVEPDPVDETPQPPVRALEQAPAAPPASEPVQPSVQQAKAPNEPDVSGDADDEADLALFGQELIDQMRDGGPVKLDASIDRVVFRQQRERLKSLGFAFDVREQSWQVAGTPRR